MKYLILSGGTPTTFNLLFLDDSGSMYGNDRGAINSSIDSFIRKNQSHKIFTINEGEVSDQYRYEPIGLTDLTVIFDSIARLAKSHDDNSVFNVYIVTDGLHNMTSSVDAILSAYNTAKILSGKSSKLNIRLALVGELAANCMEYPSYFVCFRAFPNIDFNLYIKFLTKIEALAAQPAVVSAATAVVATTAESESLFSDESFFKWDKNQLIISIALGINQILKQKITGEIKDKIMEYRGDYGRTLAKKISKGDQTIVQAIVEDDDSEFGLFNTVLNKQYPSKLFTLINSGKIESEAVRITQVWADYINSLSIAKGMKILELKLSDCHFFNLLISTPPKYFECIVVTKDNKFNVVENILDALSNPDILYYLPYPVNLDIFSETETTYYIEILTHIIINNYGLTLHERTNIFHMLNIILKYLFTNLCEEERTKFLQEIIMVKSTFHKYYESLWSQEDSKKILKNLIDDMKLAQGAPQKTTFNNQQTQHGAHVWMCLMSFFLNYIIIPKQNYLESITAILIMLVKFGTKYNSSGTFLYDYRINLQQLMHYTEYNLVDLISNGLLELEPFTTKQGETIAVSKLLKMLNTKNLYDSSISKILSFHDTGSVKATKDCIKLITKILNIDLDCDKIAKEYYGIGLLSQITNYTKNNKEYSDGALLFEKFMEEYKDLITTTKNQMIDVHKLRHFKSKQAQGVCNFCGKRDITNYSEHILQSRGIPYKEENVLYGYFILKGCKSVGSSYRKLIQSGLSLKGKKLSVKFLEYYNSPAGISDLEFLDGITSDTIKDYELTFAKKKDSTILQTLANISTITCDDSADIKPDDGLASAARS